MDDYETDRLALHREASQIHHSIEELRKTQQAGRMAATLHTFEMFYIDTINGMRDRQRKHDEDLERIVRIHKEGLDEAYRVREKKYEALRPDTKPGTSRWLWADHEYGTTKEKLDTDRVANERKSRTESLRSQRAMVSKLRTQTLGVMSIYEEMCKEDVLREHELEMTRLGIHITH